MSCFCIPMQAPDNILLASDAEHGMKLVVFLVRRLNAGRSEVQRWVRTGQVRVNGGRSGAFDRVLTGDAVRVPPFAVHLARSVVGTVDALCPLPSVGTDLGDGLRVLAVQEGVLALAKPGGLPAQSGSGHARSVASLLRDAFAERVYIPAPAHRLDKDTSGVLLAGLSHEAQKDLHALFTRYVVADAAQDGGMEKTYLAWVAGRWPHDREKILCDYVAKAARDRGAAFEVMHVVDHEQEKGGKAARSRVLPLEYRKGAAGDASLVRVVLETGRTHQIRVQLASRGFPVIGDRKYGGPAFGTMLLHAYALVFPWRGGVLRLSCRPGWPAPFTVDKNKPYLA